MSKRWDSVLEYHPKENMYMLLSLSMQWDINCGYQQWKNVRVAMEEQAAAGMPVEGKLNM